MSVIVDEISVLAFNPHVCRSVLENVYLEIENLRIVSALEGEFDQSVAFLVRRVVGDLCLDRNLVCVNGNGILVGE